MFVLSLVGNLKVVFGSGPTESGSHLNPKQNPCASNILEVLRAVVDPVDLFLKRPKLGNTESLFQRRETLEYILGWWGSEFSDQRHKFLYFFNPDFRALRESLNNGTEEVSFPSKFENRWDRFSAVKIADLETAGILVSDRISFIKREVAKTGDDFLELKNFLLSARIETYADWIEFVCHYILYADFLKTKSEKLKNQILQNLPQIRDILKNSFSLSDGLLPWFEVSTISRVGRYPLGPRYPLILQAHMSRTEAWLPVRTFHLPTIAAREADPLFYQPPGIREFLPNNQPIEFLTDALGFFLKELNFSDDSRFESFKRFSDFSRFFTNLSRRVLEKKIALGDPPLSRGLLDVAFSIMTQGNNRMPLPGDPLDRILESGVPLRTIAKFCKDENFQKKIRTHLTDNLTRYYLNQMTQEEKDFVFGRFYANSEEIAAISRAATELTQLYFQEIELFFGVTQ